MILYFAEFSPDAVVVAGALAGGEAAPAGLAVAGALAGLAAVVARGEEEAGSAALAGSQTLAVGCWYSYISSLGVITGILVHFR